MSYKVSSKDFSRISLGKKDTVASVLQNIALILKTRQGTVPMYRDFGLPQRFLGKPIHVARPLMYAEIREAIETYEPRVNVIDITFAEDADSPAGLIPTVEVEIVDE